MKDIRERLKEANKVEEMRKKADKERIAELEADTGGERVKIVNDYKVKSGRPLYGAHSLPFCYTIQDGDQKSIVKQNQEIMEDAISHVMLNHSISGALVYIKNKHNTQIGYKALANALRNELICGSYRGNPNYCPPYITREMFDKLQKARFTPNEETLAQAERLEKCDLLIIDDLGTEMPGQFVTAALYGLLNQRLLSGKPMVITTNLTVDETSNRYSPQIASRLYGEFKRLTFLGTDIRVLKNGGMML